MVVREAPTFPAQAGVNPVPDSLRSLPRHGDLPVPALFARDSRGIPDFTVLDEDEMARCVGERQCGLCGKPLGYWIAFVGGPISVANRCFTDPAMHEECATYALAVCPFLAAPRATYARRPARAGSRPARSAALLPDRPERFALYVCRSYAQRVERGVQMLRAAPAKRVDWWTRGSREL